MFLKMTDRRVLIIGGGEQAAQKMRLILKTEAEICIVADKICSEIQTVVQQGRVKHLDETVSVELMQSAILVFSATECPTQGARHAKMAKRANTIINVVDMPALCVAMTPSIVDRDPLVIAIGTEGCAPILGRQIKSKIEIMLEPTLGRLVEFAGRMRADVANNIPIKHHRRFWNWVFNASPRIAFDAGNERQSFSMIKSAITDPQPDTTIRGSLHFIAAGTKDSDLISLRDLRALQSSDLIIYETTDHQSILELARRDALRERQVFQNRSEAENTAAIQTALRDGKNIVVISTTPLSKASLSLVSSCS
ncbi:siroheme synthase [Paramylibacter ulvae]|nr:NAD(P)-dependent oxidoreductase [Amylibacter ulvae]